MKIQDLTENKTTPIIVIDIQPEYATNYAHLFLNAIQFANNQTGNILMFVNAEHEGLTNDTVDDIKWYWEQNGFRPDKWDRVEIVDKGYGYFRPYMDNNVPEDKIIKLIRYLYSKKVYSVADISLDELKAVMGHSYEDWMDGETFIIKWANVSKLKQYNGAYLFGGGREQCLREVTLLMNAFNIKYKLVDRLIYG